jgi:hypothetical protein
MVGSNRLNTEQPKRAFRARGAYRLVERPGHVGGKSRRFMPDRPNLAKNSPAETITNILDTSRLAPKQWRKSIG